jgi:hypothetical protein
MRDVGSLLNAVQDSPAAAERSLQGLVRLLSQSAAEHTPELLGGIQQLLVLDQVMDPILALLHNSRLH